MDHAELITRIGAATVAEALRCHVSRPHRWRADGHIPADRWPEIVALAKARGVEGVTLDALAAGRRNPPALALPAATEERPAA